jgi:hypothetical protein
MIHRKKSGGIHEDHPRSGSEKEWAAQFFSMRAKGR